MTEQQLRDVLARVVPEPPDSVADAGPVVRVARRQRRVRVAGVGALAAVLVAGTGFGVMNLRDDAEPDTRVADQPQSIADPFSTAPCPDPQQPWDAAPLTDLSQITAIRFCARDLNGFAGADGPRDALVTGVDAFTDAFAGLAVADPSRCAATDPVPTDSRLLVERADGTSVGLPAGFCQDAVVEGATLDGGDVTKLFLSALSAQRQAQDYADPDPQPASCDAGFGDISPAAPGIDVLAAGSLCGKGSGDELNADELSLLQGAWASATEQDGGTASCPPERSDLPLLFVRTDRGDNLQLVAECDALAYYSSFGTRYELDLSIEDLLG